MRKQRLRREGEPLNEQNVLDAAAGCNRPAEPVRGESRREVESTSGRNVSRAWDVLEQVDAPGDVAKRNETLAVGLLPKGSGRE